MSDEYISHALLKENKIEKREYQEYLYKKSKDKSSLVALPTGTGKTIVSLLVSLERIDMYPSSKVLFLAPTKPLVEQQAEFYEEFSEIDNNEIIVYTGDTRPEDRENLWNDNSTRIVVATPQVVENDLVSGRINLEDTSYITFDECHRAKGDYSYNYISEKYWKQANNSLVTGLSASPGSDKDEILNVCTNLGLINIEVVTEDMEMLSDYVYETDIEELWLDLDEETLECKNLVQKYYKEILEDLKDMGVLDSARKDLPIYKLSEAQRDVRASISGGGDYSDETAYKALSRLAEAMKVHHALETVETQGINSFKSYISKLEEEYNSSDASKAVKRVMTNNKMIKAKEIAENYDKIHPKKRNLRGIVINKIVNNEQVLVFTQYRDTANDLVNFLNDNDVIDAQKFVGQANKTDDPGMSQSRQKEVIEEFRNGYHDVLIATSVGEEGLDIPQVSSVIFYEPLPSGIRNIQRRGRTGRQSKGEVKIMIGKDTKDENYYYASKQKESNMKDDLKSLKNMKDNLNKILKEEQTDLSEYEQGTEEVVQIVADQRETSSSVIKNLDRKENVKTNVETLNVGDYIVSDRCVIERKSIKDFIDTLTGKDRDIFKQAKEISNSYKNPILLIEGDISKLYSSNIHNNAIHGTISSLAVDFNISIVWTINEQETSNFLTVLAEREQSEENREISIHGKKETKTEKEQQEFIISSIADIGPVTSKKLLNEFGSIVKIVNADIDKLKKVEGIGEQKAQYIYNILRKEYKN